jgi:hypothetical protein
VIIRIYSEVWVDKVFYVRDIQQGLMGPAWIFPGRTVHEKFSTGLSLKNFGQILAGKKFQVNPTIKISHDLSITKKIPCHFPNIRSSSALFRSYPACGMRLSVRWRAGGAGGGKRGVLVPVLTIE